MSDDKNGWWDTEDELLTTTAPCVQSELPCYATELEMEEHCRKYACKDCPISSRCSMFDNLFKNRIGAAYTDCCE